MTASIEQRGRRRLFRRAARWVLAHQGSPYNLAMGFAVGLFVALTPTVGIQMILGAAVAHLLRANRALPVALAWISNPLTMGPLYYFNYRVGLLFITGDEAAGRAFVQTISRVSLTHPEAWWDAIVLMAQELWGVAGVLWLGSLIVAGTAGLVAYPLVYRMVVAERRRLGELSSMPSQRPAELAEARGDDTAR